MMKPSEFMGRYRYDLEIDYDYVKEVGIINKNTGQTIFYKHCSEGSHKDDKRSTIDAAEFSEVNWCELDEQFIDKDDLININVGTCLGLEVFMIQKMIDFFRKKGYNPYEWKEFEHHLDLEGDEEWKLKKI